MLDAGEGFQEIGSGRDTFGGLQHLGADLAGPSHIFRLQNRAQICDQRLLGGGRKPPSGAHLQLLDPSPHSV